MATVNRFPQSLADVVSAAKVKHGVKSGRELQEKSRQLGIFISYTVLNEVEAGTYRRRMSPETRSRLAQLAGVRRQVVDRLAGAPLGAPFRLPEDEAAALTGDQRDAILSVVRAFVNANRRVVDEAVPDAALEDPRPGRPKHTPPGESEEPHTER